jgi:hypothetical protein
MVRLLLLLVVVAGVAGYFTRPTEAQMREAADAVLSDVNSVSDATDSLGATIAGDRAYSNYYVGAKYTVAVNDQPVVECWGGFTQVQCNRKQDEAAS